MLANRCIYKHFAEGLSLFNGCTKATYGNSSGRVIKMGRTFAFNVFFGPGHSVAQVLRSVGGLGHTLRHGCQSAPVRLPRPSVAPALFPRSATPGTRSQSPQQLPICNLRSYISCRLRGPASQVVYLGGLARLSVWVWGTGGTFTSFLCQPSWYLG